MAAILQIAGLDHIFTSAPTVADALNCVEQTLR